jgi:hypothetical protein
MERKLMVQLGLGQWYRRRRRQRAFKKHPPLREFVYLDDVSVFSLIASQLGPVATEFTSTEAASLQGEISGTLGANIGIKKAEASSRLQTEQTQTSQVVRRSIIQNTFKELRDHVTSTELVLNVEGPDLDMRALTSGPTLNQLEQLAPRGVVHPELLERGRLIEVDVELEADPIFKVNAAVSAVIEIVQETPQLFGDDVMASMADARAMQKIINRLLTGLVPIRGRLVDYSSVELRGERRIVRREVADVLRTSASWKVRPLYLVGVASEALFWKDVRLVLFSKTKHRVMCRLAHDGVQRRWTASKLVEVLASTFPQIGEQLDHAIDAALAALDAVTEQTETLDARDSRIREALVGYGQAIAEAHGHEITVTHLADLGLPRFEDVKGFGDLATRRLAFASMAEAVETRFGLSLDSVELSSLRSASLLKAGLDLTGQAIPSAPLPGASPPDDTDGTFLEAQLVAIYW